MVINSIRIGIGFSTTKNRPKSFKLSYNSFKQNSISTKDIQFIFHTQRGDLPFCKGVAAAKNQSLRYLIEQDCDYIFLSDDDVVCKRRDWYAPFIEAHLRTGEHHILTMPEPNIPDTYELKNGLYYWKNSSKVYPKGYFQFYTRWAIIATGAYNEVYQYCYEHEEYSQRIHFLNMITQPFISLPNSSTYIHSLDLDGAESYEHLLGKEIVYTIDNKMKVDSSISLAEMKRRIDEGEKYYNKETRVFIPLYEKQK